MLAVCQEARPSAPVGMGQWDGQEDPSQGVMSQQRPAGCQAGVRANEPCRAQDKQQALEQQTPSNLNVSPLVYAKYYYPEPYILMVYLKYPKP